MQSIKIILIFLLTFFSMVSNSKSLIKKECFLEDQYNYAIGLYENSAKLLESLELFKDITTKDSSACFWKSYVYIANIYLKLNQVDSALKILEYGKKKISLLPSFYPKRNILDDLHAYLHEVSVDSLLDLNKKRERKGWGPVFDTAPEPVGGFAELQRNLEYPEDAFQEGIEDTVIVYTFISWRGDVCRTKILKGGRLDSIKEAARKTLYKTKWKPAMARDAVCNVWVSIPVYFNLKSINQCTKKDEERV